MQPHRPRAAPSGGQFAPVHRPEPTSELVDSEHGPFVHQLDEDVLAILRLLGKTEVGRRFYLAGGTGLALQLGHRRSNDLDYFVDAERLDRPLLWKTADRVLRGPGGYEVVLNEPGQVDLAVGGRRRKVSFIAYPFTSTEPTVAIEGQRCADVLGIAAMKAYTLGRRGTARDYVDIEAAISKGGVTLADIIAAARSRFVLDGESVFSERLFLQQLVFTEDVDDADSLTSLGASFAEVERSLRSIVARYAKDQLL